MQLIVAVATHEGVVTTTTPKEVVAGTAIEDVGERIANQQIVGAGAADVLDIDQHIARGIATYGRVSAKVDLNANLRTTVQIYGPIGAEAAIKAIRTSSAPQLIVASATREDVISGAAIKEIVASVTNQSVVETRTRNVFDIEEFIARSKSNCAAVRGQTDAHASCCIFIIRRIDAIATIECVSAAAALKTIVASATVERVNAKTASQKVCVCVTGQYVVENGALEVFDANEGIAFRRATVAQPIGKRNCHASCRASLIERPILGPRAAVQNVGTGATAQSIVASATIEMVYAQTTIEQVVVGVSGQRVVKVCALKVFNVDQCVAFGGAADAGHTRNQRNHYAAGCANLIARPIDTRATVEVVRAIAAMQLIVAIAAGQIVGARSAKQIIIARAA